MAKPPKGVVPPHLRKFLFKKGHRPVGKSSKGGGRKGKSRGSAPRPASQSSRPRGSMSSTYHKAKSKLSAMLGTEVRPLQMLFSGFFGLISDKFIDRLGINRMLRSFFPTFAAFEDNVIWANNVGGIQQKGAGLSDAGSWWLATLLGGAAGGKVMWDGATKGRFTAKDVNFLGPFAIGQFFDGPEGSPTAPMGSGALGGMGGGFSGAPAGGMSNQASGAAWC